MADVTPAPYDNADANPIVEVPKRPTRESVARASEIAAKISAEDMEDAKLETSHQLRREMDEKAKAELLALAVGRNKEVETGVRYEQAADDTEDAYEPDDVVDDGADDGAYDAEAEEAERAEIARRNQDLLKLAMANNEVVQEHIHHPEIQYSDDVEPEDQATADMKAKQAQLMKLAYSNAERDSASDISDIPVSLDDILAARALERDGSLDDEPDNRTNSYKEATAGGASEGDHPSSVTNNDITAKDRHLEIVAGSAATKRRQSEEKAAADAKKSGGCCVVM